MVKCNGCKKRNIEINGIRNAGDFGRQDLTENIDWPSGDGSANKLRYIELEVVPNVDENINYKFGATFVVLVENPLPQSKASQ
jgi:hypothetical protein